MCENYMCLLELLPLPVEGSAAKVVGVCTFHLVPHQWYTHAIEILLDSAGFIFIGTICNNGRIIGQSLNI